MKIKRQAKIIELIKNTPIETQEELTALLNGGGFDATQATVSRDIRELRLTKISDGNRQRYALPNAEEQLSSRVVRIFNDGVLSIEYAQNLVVIKTLSGMAMAVASCIDSFNRFDMLGTEIIGTIAGDDCIFCAVKSEKCAVAVIGKMKELLKNDGI